MAVPPDPNDTVFSGCVLPILFFVVVMVILFLWMSTDIGYWFTCDFMGSWKQCPPPW